MAVGDIWECRYYYMVAGSMASFRVRYAQASENGDDTEVTRELAEQFHTGVSVPLTILTGSDSAHGRCVASKLSEDRELSSEYAAEWAQPAGSPCMPHEIAAVIKLTGTGMQPRRQGRIFVSGIKEDSVELERITDPTNANWVSLLDFLKTPVTLSVQGDTFVPCVCKKAPVGSPQALFETQLVDNATLNFVVTNLARRRKVQPVPQHVIAD